MNTLIPFYAVFVPALMAAFAFAIVWLSPAWRAYRRVNRDGGAR